jgi:serine/threonine-protein kinase
MTAGQLPDGRVLAGRYRVEGIIGRGGMAEVYRGADVRLARPIAIKVLRAQYALDPELRRRFEEEAKAVAMLSHPNVVAVYDAGEDESTAFIVMELVPGETLADRITRGPLDEAAVRRVGGEVLDALAAAHARGLLHRDIKPANVLLTDDGTAKVADFGIAKALHPSPDTSEPTAMHLVLGTPTYLAPERAQGNPATVRSDLWSVGVLLYESLTGEKPFEGDTPIAIALAALEGRYQPVLAVRPGVDPSLAAVIDRALQVDPDRRFSSAEEMGRALQTSNAGETVALGSPPFDPAATSVLGTPSHTMVLGGAVLAGAGLAAGEGAAGAGVGGPVTYGAAARDDSFASGRPPRRFSAPILAAAAVLVVILGLGGLLLASHHSPPTTVPTTTSKTTTTAKSKPSSTTTTTTTTTVPASSTTVAPSSTTSSSTSTTSTTSAPPSSTSPSSTTTSPTVTSTTVATTTTGTSKVTGTTPTTTVASTP